MGRKIYDLIFGIGEACSTTQTLRYLNLQDRSFPLDWCYGADFQVRINLLANKFDRFFEEEDLEFTEIDKGSKKQTFKNKFTGISFNHDFLPDIEFKKQYPEIRSKYDRRIKRLVNAIENSKKVLVVFIELPTSITSPNITDEIIIDRYQNLSKSYPNTNIDLLYIKHAPSYDFSKIDSSNLLPNIYKFQYNNSSPVPNLPDFTINYITTKLLFTTMNIMYIPRAWNE